jgi:hypothetical protein
MPPSKMTTFCKHENCPSSDDILEYQNGTLSRSRTTSIRTHLETCEFCDAEVEFYSHFPLEEGRVVPQENVAIPGPLYELAEALLKKKHTDSSSLDSLLKEKDGIVTTKA